MNRIAAANVWEKFSCWGKILENGIPPARHKIIRDGAAIQLFQAGHDWLTHYPHTVQWAYAWIAWLEGPPTKSRDPERPQTS